MSFDYNRTRFSCYFASVVQAAVFNVWPLLFVTFQQTYGLSYTKLASLWTVNFAVQLVTDLVFSKSADRHGFRRYVMLALSMVSGGFALFAAVPLLLPSDPFPGFLAATAVLAVGGGLLEIMTSPLIASLPTDSKSGSMALLHSFYAWGQAAVILLTSLAMALFGSRNWQWIVLAWAAFPLLDILCFSVSPIPAPLPSERKSSSGSVIRQAGFWFCFFIIFFGSGVESAMVQWSSAFMEQAMSLPKLLGDYGGTMMFAVCLGISRLLASVFSKKIVLIKYMFFSALLAIACYLTVALTSLPVLSLAACGLTGFAAGMLWPGTLVLAGEQFSGSGAWLFAMMAFGGDCGGAVCPWFTGVIADNAEKVPFLADWAARGGMSASELGLRSALGFATVYAVITSAFLLLLMRSRRSSGIAELRGK